MVSLPAVLDLHILHHLDLKFCEYATSVQRTVFYVVKSKLNDRIHCRGTFEYLHRVGGLADEDRTMAKGVKNVLLLLSLR